MKKSFLSLVALLIASATFTACSNDNETAEQSQPFNGKYTLTIEANKGGEADSRITRALELDGKTLNATWATTEDVFVQKGSDWATGSLKPQEAGANTTLKGELSDITIEPADELTLQFPRSGEKDYTGQVGTLADIAAKYDYATASVTVASVTGGNITTTGKANFENQQAIVKFTLIDKADGTSALNASELVVSDGTNSYTITPASATSELYVAIPGFSGKTVTLEASVGGKLYTFSRKSVTFYNGQYYEITVKMSAVPGTLAGLFTINASGDQVRFSQGNLQYQASTATWRFAANQMDHIGNAAGNNTFDNRETQTGWIDLFGWGTSGYNHGATAYQPWSFSTTSSDYYAYGNSSKNLYDENGKADWGYNAISNGGNKENSGWRTLTQKEWEYVLNRDDNKDKAYGRTDAYRFGKAKIHDVYGVIIFPDGFDPTALGVTIGDLNPQFSSSFTSYSNDDWAKMEAAGVVFLPAADFRDGNFIKGYNDGNAGYYWTSTAYSDLQAIALYFYEGTNSVFTGACKNYKGYSVRLAKNK